MNLGFRFYTGVPCSYLNDLINEVIATPKLTYLSAANEGDAVAAASGATVAGSKSVVLMQNSGLGNAVSPLTSLSAILEIPCLILCSLRGDPDGDPNGKEDEPQHRLMGSITVDLLQSMQIGFEFIGPETKNWQALLQKADIEISKNRRPFALVVRKNAFSNMLSNDTEYSTSLVPSTSDVLSVVIESSESFASETKSEIPAIFSTTGYISRNLCSLKDRPNHIYLVGSMGCVSSFGLGYSINNPDRRVWVIDGDGSVLMRMGSLSTIGSQPVSRFTHIVIDNEVYESTGSQLTTSNTTKLEDVAKACGYRTVHKVNGLSELHRLLHSDENGPRFILIKTRHGNEGTAPPRPKLSPAQVARRFESADGK